MKPHILVVDDEIRYQHLLRVNLESEGYEISTAGDGEQAIEMIANRRPDMVILDVMMPRLDGYSTCERIRQFSSVPIIMLTGKAEEDDRVRGLNAGADDYVAKPFSATELVARVRAVLRRAVNTESITQSRYFSHGNLRIDFARAEVWRDDRPIYLSATEYRLLIQFAHHVGQVLNAEELLLAVWGDSYREDKEILWVSIARLRQKLEDNPHSPQHIVTRAGLGYLMPPLDTINPNKEG
ncbi:MAG TPA: response regulator transcription factor [Anaerolineaceae bacterium]|nr:response regulator transcription factor [Longilinea sp.]HNZ00510.1 response regulator transcription factor [Anaerolineaceae bacterium]HOH19812.1 response regulator transcription factor [Anaerolineaceae bacterium]HOU44174.1 response regulator transcription factor [Anaerolineaceae bacterium]HPA33669.1 response regulator transcription factor [Anaerolineaceae bacterium]